LKTMLLMDRYASHSVHFSVSRSLSLISQTQGKRQSGTCHSMVDHDFPYKEVRLWKSSSYSNVGRFARILSCNY
jgi:hypothetical protein